jgi:RNA polymerase sigma-70 factor (ECF subfamily)
VLPEGLLEATRHVPKAATFHDEFVGVFNANFRQLFRYLDRLSGDADLAADLAQEAFVRLYRRGSLPEQPRAWLITVAMNLFRNAKSTHVRRRALITVARVEATLSDPAPRPDESTFGAASPERVRAALDQLAERERALLLLRAEGYSYRDIALALDLNEASIGTLLARAKREFRTAFEEGV